MNFRSFSFILVGFLFLFLQVFLFNVDDFLLIVFGFFFFVFYFILLLVSIGIDLYRLISDQDIIPFKSTIIGVVMIFMNVGFGQYLSVIYKGNGSTDEFYVNENDKLSLFENGNFSYSEDNLLGGSISYGHFARKGDVIYFDNPINASGENAFIGKIINSQEIQFYKGKSILTHNKLPL